MKRSIFVLFILLLLLSSCAWQNIATDEQTDQNSETEHPIQNETSNTTEVETTGIDPIQPIVPGDGIIVCNTLTAPLIQLPYHSVEDIPSDFVLSMQNNPIDRDMFAMYMDIDTSSVGAMGDFVSEYSEKWRNEMDNTIDQIVSIWGEDMRSDLMMFVESSIKLNEDATGCEYHMFFGENIDLGRYAIACGIFTQEIDTCRNITFMLKYYLYLSECAQGGEASKSLLFEYRPQSDQPADTEYIVVTGDHYLVTLTLSPSFTTSYGTEFVENVKDILKQTHDEAYWHDALLTAKANIANLAKVDCLEDYCADYLTLCERQSRIEDYLLANGYITNEQIQASKHMCSTEMNLALKLMYWQFVLETETAD